ncbi:hypothetical protein [Prevotella pallens]|uniref:hypothetical protein n=1 Tax=Prevotella pallens TaxID=60133 RepID=UPI0028E76146|nr:hypothetical protein [Prevotella pallens]
MDINKHTNAHTIPFVYGAKYTAANNTQYPFIAQMYGNKQYVRHRADSSYPFFNPTQMALICRNDANCNANGINTQYNFGVFVDTGTINRTPTAADSLPITLQTDCNNTTFKKQKPYFCNAKTYFLPCKNPLFARQKPYFC